MDRKLDNTEGKLIYQIQLDLSLITDEDKLKPFFSRIEKHIKQLEAEYLAPVELIVDLKRNNNSEHLTN